MLLIANWIQTCHLNPPFVASAPSQRQLHIMSGYVLLTVQLAAVSLLVTLWRASRPNSRSNRVVSYIINVGNTPKIHQKNKADFHPRTNVEISPLVVPNLFDRWLNAHSNLPLSISRWRGEYQVPGGGEGLPSVGREVWPGISNLGWSHARNVSFLS